MGITKVRANQVYGVSGMPNAYLKKTEPNSFLPAANYKVKLIGSFFKPDSVIVFEGHTIIKSDFISDNEFEVEFNSAGNEGDYNISIDGVIFLNAFLIRNGELIPLDDSSNILLTNASVINNSLVRDNDGIRIQGNTYGNLVFNPDVDFEFAFDLFDDNENTGLSGYNRIRIRSVEDNTRFAEFRWVSNLWRYTGGNTIPFGDQRNYNWRLSIKRVNGQLGFYNDGNLTGYFNDAINDVDCEIAFIDLAGYTVNNIKIFKG